MSEPETYTLTTPTAEIAYDVRRNEASTEPPLLLVGSPMGAAGFTSLAQHFTDRTLVTYDPRGAERSRRTDGATQSTPDEHADDIGRVIDAVGGTVDLFASSGGAVNALALVAKQPEKVRTLVAHEPPAAQVLPDREAALAASKAVADAYQAGGTGPGMAKFIALVMLKGEVPSDWADQAAPDPAMFGLPTEDDGSRDDVMLAQNMITCTHYEHDFDAIRDASTRVVLAAGVESEGELAHRAAQGVAERLGTGCVIFPSNHGGFLGGEYGQTGEPEAFAVKLREVLEHAAITAA
ncbi:MAG TPA: alpha/beta fold hydrolase [Nocardioidaceae bacterium]|nr:alpha/beta fold hydrolase [Nocardioidaceae bacterium]